MNPALKSKCDLFVENRDIVKSAFHWEVAYMYPLGAYLFTASNQHADQDILEECKGLLKAHTGVFSNFRGNCKIATIAQLAMSSNREARMNTLLSIYEMTKEIIGRGGEYMIVVANLIAELAEPRQYQEVIQRTNTLYHRMKQEHPFLTTKEDCSLAALLALSERDDDALITDMEACYELLNGASFSKNAMQSLSHILALFEEVPKVKCDRVIALYQALKKAGHPYGKYYELATLGVLAMLDEEISTLVGMISEVDDELKQHKGFGAFGIGSKQRVMYAGMLVTSMYTPNMESLKTAALSGVLSLVIAQQAVLCASMAATSAAASANAGN